MKEPPRIETERLVLRPRTLQDFDAYAAMWVDERVWRFTTGAPVDRENAWRRFLGQVGHWDLMGFGYWAIAERVSPDRYIGEVGFADFKRDLSADVREALGLAAGESVPPDAGWALDPAFHGRGYAREAVGAAMDWWDISRRGQMLLALVAPQNLVSRRLADAFDFATVAETNYRDFDTIIFRRTRNSTKF